MMLDAQSGKLFGRGLDTARVMAAIQMGSYAEASLRSRCARVVENLLVGV